MATNNSIADGGRRLGVFALGSFNLGLVTLLAIIALHLGGGLSEALSGLNTLVGLVLYGGLWWLVTWSVGRSTGHLELRDAKLPSWGDTLEAGTKGGAITGVALAGVLGAFGVLFGLFGLVTGGEPRSSIVEAAQGIMLLLGAVVIYALVGGLVAFVVGVTMGAVLALVDRALLGVARALEGGAPH
jgi:hypothetical protein